MRTSSSEARDPIVNVHARPFPRGMFSINHVKLTSLYLSLSLSPSPSCNLPPSLLLSPPKTNPNRSTPPAPARASRKSLRSKTRNTCTTSTSATRPKILMAPSSGRSLLAKSCASPVATTSQPCMKRLYEQIRQRYYNRDIQRYIDNFNCDYCHRNKLDGKG